MPWALSAMSLFPVFGGALSTLVGALPSEAKRRIDDLMRGFADGLDELGLRLDTDFVPEGEFTERVWDVWIKAIDAKEAEMREHWGRLLAHLVQRDGSSNTEHGRLVDSMSRLRLHHLDLLHAIDHEPKPPNTIVVEGDVQDLLRERLPGVAIEDIEADWADLAAAHLVTEWGDWGGDDNIRGKILPLGRRLIQYLGASKDPG